MFGENIKSVFSEILHGKAVASHSVKQEKNDDNTQYSNYGKAATEFSNPYNDQFHLFNGKGDMHEGLLNSLRLLGQHNINGATKFSNGNLASATEFSNFNNMDDSHAKLVNISAMELYHTKNFSKSTTDCLISEWTGSDLYC
ncbi:MAG TPA: hypothetical protein VFG45_06665 [Candidatus Nitrosocosmicus sp.]|nr:hypothetical protein [Candidatus Nitrosocosmicus sp.]